MNSIIIKEVLIVDGTGNKSFIGDIAIDQDRITAVEKNIPAKADQVIDGTGLAASPGFIDIHSHTDKTIFTTPAAESKVFQGVTTEVVGNCGIGTFPVATEYKNELNDYLRLLEGSSIDVTWKDFSGFAMAAALKQPAVNLVPLIGHGTLRIATMGRVDRSTTAIEMALMKKLLAENLEQGAWGMSTGLIYPPGSFADSKELLELSKVLHLHGGIYVSHIRGESSSLLAAVNEAITIAKQAGITALISHLKAIGTPYWGNGAKALKHIEYARSLGTNVWADQYPYQATSTGLSALLPSSIQAGGLERMLTKIADSAWREEIMPEIDNEISIRGGAEKIVISSVDSLTNKSLCGLSLYNCAKLRRSTPAQTVLDLILEERGSIGAIYYSLSEKDLEEILSNGNVAVGSDGYAFSIAKDRDNLTHPRSYGTFPRILGLYVREKKLLTLETAIKKMTSLPAQIIGIQDRGTISPGSFADITIFNPSSIKDNATFEHPHQYPTGIAYVIVNGQITLDKNGLTGKRGGLVLKRQNSIKK